jgi:hypothetical protein
VKQSTFGGSPAAAILADILTKRNNVGLTRKVSACLQDFYLGIREIRKTNIGFMLREMWKKHFLKRVEGGFDREIANFMRNVIITECRKETKNGI